MVHEIFHEMFESKKRRLCWGIHVATETHGEILKIITSFNIDVHESANPLIEVSYMIFLNLF